MIQCDSCRRGVQVWAEVGAKQCREDEHLVMTLVPRVIAALANRHGAPAGEASTLLDNELLLQVALALGQMETAALFDLDEGLHRMSPGELRAAIEVRTGRALPCRTGLTWRCCLLNLMAWRCCLFDLFMKTN